MPTITIQLPSIIHNPYIYPYSPLIPFPDGVNHTQWIPMVFVCNNLSRWSLDHHENDPSSVAEDAWRRRPRNKYGLEQHWPGAKLEAQETNVLDGCFWFYSDLYSTGKEPNISWFWGQLQEGLSRIESDWGCILYILYAFLVFQSSWKTSPIVSVWTIISLRHRENLASSNAGWSWLIHVTPTIINC